MTEQQIEELFVEWFNSNASPYTFLSEWFYGDVELKDIELRKDMMYNWLKSSYSAGYADAMKIYEGTKDNNLYDTIEAVRVINQRLQSGEPAPTTLRELLERIEELKKNYD